jgi:hypothetical protein
MIIGMKLSQFTDLVGYRSLGGVNDGWNCRATYGWCGFSLQDIRRKSRVSNTCVETAFLAF